MADKRSSISAQLRADASGWKRGCDVARAETGRLKKDIEGTKINGPSADGFKKQFARTATEITAKAGLLKDVFSFAMAPAEANVWYQDMIDGLSVVTGSAQTAQEQMARLQAISDRQRLSDEALQTIVEYNKHLQTLGYSAESSIQFISELSNAAEAFGGDVGMFSGVISALSKVGQTGNDSAKTLMQMANQAPEVRKLLEAGFGTSSAGNLDKLNLSAKNLFDGIMIGLRSIETSNVDIASVEGIVSQQMRTRQALGADDAKNRGLAAMQARRVQDAEWQTTQAREKLLSQSKQEAETAAQIEAFNAENLRMTKAVQAESKAAVDAKKKQEADSAADAKRANEIRLRQLDDISAIAAEQQAKFAIETETDPTKKAALEAELEIQQRINSIKDSSRDVSDEITKAIRDQVFAGKEYEKIISQIKDKEEKRQQNAEIAKAAAEKRKGALDTAESEMKQLEIASLRQRGKTKQADKLEDKMERDRLIGEGWPGAKAEEFVKRKRQAKEDEPFGVGRRKIRRLDEGMQKGFGIPVQQKPVGIAAPVKQEQQNQNTITQQDAAQIIAKLSKIEINTQKPAAEQQVGIRK